MKILVGCEESQAVTLELRLLGHEAYSNDIIEQSGGYAEWHLQMDIFDAIQLQKWDMLIAFPPCTDLAVSGNQWRDYKKHNGIQDKAIEFVKNIWKSNIKKVAIENPKGILSTYWMKPTQIIQPWQFGHGYTKETHLWLRGLPLLKPTMRVTGREDKIYKMSNTQDRATLRSKTPQGLAKAMAKQWTEKQYEQLSLI